MRPRALRRAETSAATVGRFMPSRATPRPCAARSTGGLDSSRRTREEPHLQKEKQERSYTRSILSSNLTQRAYSIHMYVFDEKWENDEKLRPLDRSIRHSTPCSLPRDYCAHRAKLTPPAVGPASLSPSLFLVLARQRSKFVRSSTRPCVGPKRWST